MSCSEKSKYKNNPQYECGPNGRYRLKAEFKQAKVGCSDKSKYVNDERYECGPGGKYVLKKGYKSVPLPGAPKKPTNAYMLWMKANRAQLKQALIDAGLPAGVTDVAKAGGAAWKSVAADVKQSYLDQANESKTTYSSASAEFKAANNGKTNNIQAKGKKAPSGYNLWYKQVGFPQWKAQYPGQKVKVTEAAGPIGAQWKALGAAGQTEWNNKAKSGSY